MSRRELEGAKVMGRMASGELQLGDAAAMLEVSYRQTKRLSTRYRETGRQAPRIRELRKKAARGKEQPSCARAQTRLQRFNGATEVVPSPNHMDATFYQSPR